MVVKRRDFVCLTVLGSSVALLGGGCGENDIPPLDADVDLNLADYPNLADDGGRVSIPTSVTAYIAPIFVTRIAEGEYQALSGYCNHEGCSVKTNGDGYRCPCHGASFGADGSLNSGPATKGLREFPTMVNGDTLTILA